MSLIQRTLVVLKPDAVGRSLIGEIITRFERAGLNIVAMKMMKPDADFLHKHYEGIGKLGERRGEKILQDVIEMMMAMPVVAMCIEGIEAVEFVRKIVGKTEPKSALPGTIRGDYSHISYGYVDSTPSAKFNNLVHASADLDEAKQEVALWFSDAEIHPDAPVHNKFTR